jgi:hypothetical protein
MRVEIIDLAVFCRAIFEEATASFDLVGHTRRAIYLGWHLVVRECEEMGGMRLTNYSDDHWPTLPVEWPDYNCFLISLRLRSSTIAKNVDLSRNGFRSDAGLHND